LNVPAAAVFVFDDRGQVERECHEALAQRWVVFNPAKPAPAKPA